MQMKTTQTQKIQDERERRVCFKKRRIGLVKKAMQLSKLSDCQIEIKIFNPEGQSLLLYRSSDDHDLDMIKPTNT